MKTTLNGILTLLLVLVVQISFAQEKTISGTVSDQNNVVLGGVNILVQGTSNGTQSDFDGNFTINASVGQTLVFTYIGMKQTTAIVGSSNVINIQMQEDAQALEEVVVSALGVTREKKALGYSQQTVKGENLVQTKEVDLNRHKQNKHGKTYFCEKCNYRGANFSSLNNHKQDKHSEKYSCNQCDYECAVLLDLNIHKQSEHGVNPTSIRFSCDQCKYEGAKESDLKQRREILSGTAHYMDQAAVRAALGTSIIEPIL